MLRRFLYRSLPRPRPTTRRTSRHQRPRPQGGSAMNQPIQPIPPASDTLPATNAAPISVPQSATPAPNDPPDQSALKAEVTGGSAMNQPMHPIPPASDTLPATNAAPISVPQSATPAPNDPA